MESGKPAGDVTLTLTFAEAKILERVLSGERLLMGALTRGDALPGDITFAMQEKIRVLAGLEARLGGQLAPA